MNVTVLYIEDCPNVGPLVSELQELLVDRSDVTLTTTLVSSESEAARLGFHGSPTILVDGRDPFPVPAEAAGLSCRRYPCCSDAAGQAPGFPSRDKLARMLQVSG